MDKHRQSPARRTGLIGLTLAGFAAVTLVAGASTAAMLMAGASAAVGTNESNEKYCKTFKRYRPASRGDADPGQLEQVCRPGYAIQHNAKTKNPDWVIEILLEEDLKGTPDQKAKRKNNFKREPAISEDKAQKWTRRARLCHYRFSGFARGHQSPAADYKFNQKRMNDSFYLSNMSPQVGPGFNSGIWARLEERVRDLVVTRKKLVVFTGPIYDASDKDDPDWIAPEKAFIWGDCPVEKKARTGVAVPDGFYKIVYDPRRRRVLAFALPNRRLSGRKIGEFRATIREIEELTGINFFPNFKRRTQNILELNVGEMWRW
jgi:endonuclease G, mitochondrial